MQVCGRTAVQLRDYSRHPCCQNPKHLFLITDAVVAELVFGAYYSDRTEDFDLLIGCAAKAKGLTIVTHNVKHFEHIEGLDIEDG